ncbi:endolytic transglycosylase MltG [Parvibaculum sedimenti]|uniref:Endolytic murein transglycosylase n=1 Tax=Parvibaculum sedimenti TaxID=2608632 RepID=A0A6N6VJT2_9HYPH|nr:endolytic transglycosylase MltG [Parvibaculum sedimenti]KAB7740477.1 endolytic transglycosylase MltG [Parvibaculum sedimenti]
MSDGADTGEAGEPGTEARPGLVRRFLLGLIVVLPMSAALIAGGAFLYGKWRFNAPGPAAAPTVVWLAPGHGLSSIAERLREAHVLDETGIFRLAVELNRAAGALKAGEYEIPAHASMADIVRILREGKSIVHRITVPEGLTSQEAMEIVRADPVLTGDMPPVPAEGSLLPETYNFSRGTTRAQIVQRMQKSASALINEAWPHRTANLPYKTQREAIILASIVEKETGLAAERPKVAAVFVNRLRKPMRLQSDPTIIYGITGGKGPLGRPIRQSELDRVTPYNTYQVDGLPPTPICNPGRASIEAVLNPPETNDLYFVADGTGGHAFASSLADHGRNVARWRQVEKKAVQVPVKAAEERTAGTKPVIPLKAPARHVGG